VLLPPPTFDHCIVPVKAGGKVFELSKLGTARRLDAPRAGKKCLPCIASRSPVSNEV
jgi:hypothetical protein